MWVCECDRLQWITKNNTQKKKKRRRKRTQSTSTADDNNDIKFQSIHIFFITRTHIQQQKLVIVIFFFTFTTNFFLNSIWFRLRKFKTESLSFFTAAKLEIYDDEAPHESPRLPTKIYTTHFCGCIWAIFSECGDACVWISNSFHLSRGFLLNQHSLMVWVFFI